MREEMGEQLRALALYYLLDEMNKEEIEVPFKYIEKLRKTDEDCGIGISMGKEAVIIKRISKDKDEKSEKDKFKEFLMDLIKDL